MAIFGGASMFGGAGYYTSEAEAHAIIQDELAEAWLYRPMKTQGVNFPQVPDTTRRSVIVRGIFEWEAKDVNLRVEHAQVSSRAPCITFHTCSIYSIRRRDVFVRELDGSEFEVKEVRRDGVSGVKVEMIQLGVQD